MLLGHKGRVFDCRFSPVNKSSGQVRVATASEDGTVRIWDTRTRRCVSCLLPSGVAGDEALRVAWSPCIDDDMCVTGHATGAVTLWKVGTAQELGQWKIPSVAVRRTADGEEVMEPEQVYVLEFPRNRTESSSSASWFLAGGRDKIYELDIEYMKPRCSWQMSLDGGNVGSFVIGGLDRNPDKVNFVFDSTIQSSPGNWVFAAACSDGVVRVFDRREKNTTRNSVATMEGHSTFVTSCSFNQDSTTLISSGGDGFLCIYDCRRWKKRKMWKAHDGSVYGCCFSTLQDPEEKTLPSTQVEEENKVGDSRTENVGPLTQENRKRKRTVSKEEVSSKYLKSAIVSWSSDGSVKWWTEVSNDKRKGQFDTYVDLLATHRHRNYSILTCAIDDDRSCVVYGGSILKGGGSSGSGGTPFYMWDISIGKKKNVERDKRLKSSTDNSKEECFYAV
eukprot:g5440.t1